MKRTFYLSIIICILFPLQLFSQVVITISADVSHPVSPYLYGRNNSLSDSPGSALSAAAWTKLKDSGVKLLRESGGNNCTKYNWRLKLTSHPDWYNNVYSHDWDFAAQSLQENIPGAQGMWAFQLLGKAAKTSSANFNDWGYNQSQWWTGVAQNLAGGGTADPDGGSEALMNGDPDLYLENWTADSTVLILDHWFNDLGLDKNKVMYWNMDNEVEIWNGTHDDVMPTQITPEEFMQRYFAVAKKAREAFPDIKLVGPVTANEWQWYNWATPISVGGKSYSWLEFFIKRIGEEEAASGVRLLDVLDIHFYPSGSQADQVVQYHRVFFDKNYDFPGANGVKTVNGGWDNSITKEYIFERCKEWLNTYLGEDNGVTFGITEAGLSTNDATINAIWYESTLGEFMKHPEMEIFTPWSWVPSMWEVLHLNSRYNKPLYVNATSSEEELVSAYPTRNETGDSLTVVLVNRSASASKQVKLNFSGFTLANENFEMLKLSNFSSSETFMSDQNNAIQKSMVSQTNNSISLTLSPMSIVSLRLKGSEGGAVVTGVQEQKREKIMNVFPNPVLSGISPRFSVEVNKTGNAKIEMLDLRGSVIQQIHDGIIDTVPFRKDVDVSGKTRGAYLLRLNLEGGIITKKLFIF